MCDVVLARQGRAANRGAARQQQRVALMVSGLAEIIACFCWRGCLCAATYTRAG
jgi:hypothetical protein